MKKYIKILSISVTTLFMGCSDQLELFPVDSLVEETAYNTVSDLQFGINGVIGNFDFRYAIGFNSIFTDNTTLGEDTGGQDTNYGQQDLISATGGFSFGSGLLWNNRYANINNMNRLFEAAATITPSPGEQDQYNNILAQNYAFRALAHYELLLYYGLNIQNGDALGVPYVDYVSADATPARNTTAEVLEGNNNDLDQAIALFPEGFSDINFATPDFVNFLRARIALETLNNPEAINLANGLIADYDLANQAEYFDMFREDANKTEVVYNFDNVQGFDYNINFVWNFNGQGPKFEMSTELYNLLEDDDIRKTVLVDPISNPAEGLIVVGKYPENADFLAINDFKAMRISEMYLLRAEAYAKSGQFTLAANDVLAVQTARKSSTPEPITFSGLPDAIEQIIAERRIELAFEAHRYIDIKRVRNITNQGIVRIEELGDCGGAYNCILAPGDNRFTLPIPIAETNANPVITQAPGY
ncbi:RagB/SusD family nutrient uptake outer membrane protein [Psychroserpens sp. Hel_I_66]|uniref:RagB/SusD family nutrient uptake outer membrane protein n=1 Tax=Psychroserpens sp. Hel_I_66 TaxID=1250004 RepID=UPI000646A1D2|nr:RagB/SusD family nutrient uptake outer membrane protein [Psychroserpens sp. Hel_I_66]